MESSYKDEDVTLLLKDITGLVKPLDTADREELIQSGIHYSEMLPLEYQPSEKYMQVYKSALKNYSKATAKAVAKTTELIYKKKGKDIVIVSLARAGTPIGILIKRYLKKKYDISAFHYSISIIRDKGIDKNAMNFILNKHKAESIQFVDGWIGKGTILNVLKEALKDYPSVSAELAVLSDPACITDLCGTHEDILIPSSCLNSTVSGLVSRTFLRDDVIGDSDFHGAAFYKELTAKDLTYDFIDSIEKEFVLESRKELRKGNITGVEEVKKIGREFNIQDVNFIKPGIGETTRVLLRRVPWRILISDKEKNSPLLQHIYQLADEKGVKIEYYPLVNYKTCGIIKNLADI